jgi:hypothetical protein
MTGFIAACLVQLAGGILLILLRPSGFAVLPAGMLLSAVFWWGFDLPLAWLSTALDIPVLAAAWLVYRNTSRHPAGKGQHRGQDNSHLKASPPRAESA